MILIIKTILSADLVLKHGYKTCFPNHVNGSGCFEILGFDILLDHKCKPWLLEVNHACSFHTDAPLDMEIKSGVIFFAMKLLRLSSDDRRRCLYAERQRVRIPVAPATQGLQQPQKGSSSQ